MSLSQALWSFQSFSQLREASATAAAAEANLLAAQQSLLLRVAQAYYDATEQPVIDAQNALDDAELLMTEVTGSSATSIAALRDSIPL